MTTASIITTAITGSIILLLIFYLNKSSQVMVKDSGNGNTVLRINKIYQILGLFCLILSGIFIILIIVYLQAEIFLYGGMSFIFFLTTGILCLLFYRNHMVIFNNASIFISNYLGKATEMTWDDLERLTFNPVSGFFRIFTKSGEKVTIHQHLVGLRSFLHEIYKKTSIEVEQSRFPF